MKTLLATFILLCAGATWAQAPAPDVAWPRQAKDADGTVITVYQPQVESWADNVITGRAAVAVLRPGEKDPAYGVIELAARTSVDKASDLATLSALRITKSTFPGASEADVERYRATLRGAVTRTSWPVSVQALQANLAITQARSKQKTQAVKNDPPQIIFRTVPSILVLVDGEPALRALKEVPNLSRVINTTALMLQESPSALTYLWAFARWWQAADISGEWRAAGVPPPALEQVRASLSGKYEPLDGKDADGKPAFDPGVVPQIVVATRPSELLQTKGEPQLSPILGTQLLYMQNSPNDIFFDLASQTYFVLISGRWFNAKAMTGPWNYVSGRSLPADFKRIPADHQMGDVLASVPDTPQAREAAIANQIPQTASVQRDIQPTPAPFDGGEPQWQAIEGTPLSYSPNTQSPVIRVDAKAYYMVQNGVWFAAAAPAGPWAVAVSVPAVIYTIPPSSPMHYVTYVRVYGSTKTVVYVGYTPGYYGTVVSSDGSVVVYGTGYYYPPYLGPYSYWWYPYPPTYGFGWYGGGFGFVIGGMPPWHVGGCCWTGGIPPRVTHHGGLNVDSSYNRWGGKSTTITGPGGRNVKASQVGNTTLAKGSGSDNVYAGRDGNVYRRDESGDWQKYQGRGEGWSDMERPSGDRQPRADQKLPGETRGSLDRQAQARSAGDMRAQQARSGGGFQGGGGFGGGGRGMGGGGRGGGGRR